VSISRATDEEDTSAALVSSVDRHGIALATRPIARRHPLRWLLAGIALALIGWIVSLFANSSIMWERIPEFFWSPALRSGLVGTVSLTLWVMIVAIFLGVLLAVASQSGNWVLRWVAAAYVWFFRGVPALVQLLIWFNLAVVIPTLNLGPIFQGSTNELMTPFVAALLGLGLAESAYMAEIIRGGILSIPHGQIEAAKSIGMTSTMTMRRIILPQMIRVVVPPTGNQFIGMLKYTSLAFAVSYRDLLSEASRIYNSNFQVMEVLFAATAWYLILTTLFSVIQGRIERALALPSGSTAGTHQVTTEQLL
jgi:polar amino acid transport system permease protein